MESNFITLLNEIIDDIGNISEKYQKITFDLSNSLTKLNFEKKKFLLSFLPKQEILKKQYEIKENERKENCLKSALLNVLIIRSRVSDIDTEFNSLNKNNNMVLSKEKYLLYQEAYLKYSIIMQHSSKLKDFFNENFDFEQVAQVFTYLRGIEHQLFEVYQVLCGCIETIPLKERKIVPEDFINALKYSSFKEILIDCIKEQISYERYYEIVESYNALKNTSQRTSPNESNLSTSSLDLYLKRTK